MPQYTVDIPGKGQFDVDSPVELTDEQAYQAVRSQIGKETPQREGTAGFFEGVVGGAKNILSGSQTAVEAPFISGEEAALRGIERQKGRTERPGFSLDEIIKTYDQDGLFSAAGETLSQIPGAIGEQLPFLASMKAGFAAGSALPLPPQAKLLAGVAGSLLTPFLVSSGSAMERKASEQLKRGDKVDINELGAYGTGLASAGLERAALGLSGLSKVMGIDFLKGAGTETAEQIARRSLAATLAKGGGKLVAAEVPTEMGQQALERYYAGLSLTDEEAMREYAEAGAGAAMLAPLGMAGSAYQRSQVRKDIKKREEGIQKENERIKREQEAELKRKEEEKEITETAAKLERQRIEQEAQERKDAIEAELQRARETGEPVKSIQQIINEMTGVVQDPLDEKQLADIAKIDTERDRVFSQLRADRDSGAITEDEYKGKLLFLDEQVSKAKKELSQKQVKERKSLTGKKLTARQKQFQEALDEPSGQFVAGADGVERQLTEAETQGVPVQEYDPTKQKLTKEFITTKKGLGIPTGLVPKNLTGLDPTNVEDNGIIRLTLNENLKTRRKGLDDAPSLEAQQKRQEVITKIETYLTALPTTQELENAEYQKAFDVEAARRGDEVDAESAAADAALFSIDEAGRTDRPTIADDELARRAGSEPTSLVDPETGEIVDVSKAVTREEFDRQQAEATNKELARDARVIRQKAKKAPTLRKVLTDIGIARSQMNDITGETKGNTFLFRNDGDLIEDIVSDNRGNILEYAPGDMVERFVSDSNQGLFNNELVNFFRDKIRDNDLNIRPVAVQETLFEADNIEQAIEDNKKSIKAKPKTTAPAATATPLTNKEIEINKRFPADFEATQEPYSLAGSIEQVVTESREDYQARLNNYLNNRIEGETESDFNKRTGLKDVKQTSAKTGKPRKASTLTGELGDIQYAGEKRVRALSQIPPGTQINWDGKDWTVDEYEISDADRRAPGNMTIRLISRDTGEGLSTTLGGLVSENTSGSIYNKPLQKTPATLGWLGSDKKQETQPAATPTQEQRVIETLEKSDTPLSVKQIAEQTDILEPNVRRITGQGAKTGKFERVDKGVYTLTTPDGKKIAHIEVGDAVNVLPKLVEQGEKFDMIFLDPAYFSRALIGGNRGIKDYEFMRTPEFKKAMESVPNLIKETDGHVYLMLSGAPSAQQDMLPYLNAMNEVGLSVVGEGEYKKLFKNGKPVTNVRGKEASAERIFLLTKSGIARKGEKTLDNLNFRFVRPSVRSSYSTEKAPQLLNALITNSTFEGESVLDPFAGSGVTGAEAVKAGRQATLVEKSEKAVEDYIIPKIEGAQDNIQESRTETEQDKLAFELREAEYQAGSYIKASERVPKRLRDRIKKLKEQLSVQESRSDTLGPVETADSITESLRKEFGSDIDKAIDSGQLVIVNNLSELPNNFNFAPTANGAYDPRSNKVYIVASKVMPGQGRKVLLHELGEHYGLERMLGDSYGATLGRLNSLKNTDPKVKAVWDQVGRQYPDIEVGGKLYLQEVMAKIGEQSPQNTLFKRVVAAVKNFLRKLGFFNPNTLTTADMQDLIMYSTRSALAKSDKVTGSQLAAGQMQMQLSKEEGPGASKAAQEAATRLLGLPPDNTAMDRARAMGFDVDNIFYHGTTKDFDAFELDPNKVGSRERDFSHLGKAYEGKYYFSGDGIYLTQNQEVARYFGINTVSGEAQAAALATLKGEKPAKVGLPKVMPLMVKGEIFDFKNPEHIERIKQPYQNYNEFEKGLPGTSRLNKTEINNIAKGLHSTIENNHVVFQRLGFDGAKMFEPKRFFSQQNLDKNAITTVIYNPVNIRSTDAAFNPESTTSPNLMFSKTDVPAGLEQTSVYLSGVKDNSKTFYNNFVGPGLDKLINQPVDTLASLWNQGRVKMAYSGAGIERKLVNEYEGAVTKEGVGVRADIIMSQALDDSVIASQSAAEGKVVLGEDRVARVVIDENNINNLVKLRQQLADQTSIEFAEGLIQSYTSARRYRLELDRVEKRAANIASRKQAIKTANQELKTAKGDDKKQLNKLIARYQKQNERDKEKNESITITPEQEAAIEPGLAYAQQYPVLVEVGAMIDAINKNRIDLLEQSGVYTKDMADDYRDREGYVPLFREMIEDLGKGDQTITQYFSGFADIGREYGFTGSDKDTKYVLGNLLQQHFWAVSASLRNNANYEAAKQVGLHDDQNNLILSDKKPETGTAAPVMVDGERKFVEYSDPALAIGIQGALPVYKGILKWFGLAAKWFRLGITANPVFQTYQVINDALGAAMYSGVRSPLKLGKEIIGGYVRDQYFRDTKAIDAQMARLGIAGGFGRTPGDIFLKAQRQLGVENMTKWQKLVDATDAFASRSDLAQRRGIFVQTLLESGGVRQADGSVAGGNEILAMNRALNIINWQKRGASSSVRTMTHVIPFANAYLQGMDVLLNAMAGKGLSGTDAQTARILFLKTALALTMFNMLYSMIVAGEEEYDELDDRIKFRNYIVPGTGFKLPVRAEISLLTKYLPEQAYQYVTKLGTTNEVDATKLFNGMSLAVRDAAMGPNLFPQLIRGSVEVATNYNFYSGRPLIGLGLSRLDTAEQYNEATSELAKLLGSTGMVAPINADHIIRSYFGTVGSTALFVIDQAANTMIGNEKPAMRLKDFPLISPLLYSAQGRDKLNDFYELKQASDEATATVNRLMKYNPKKAIEYRKDNARMIGTRAQVNRLSNTLKDLRARRKLIIESGMDGDKKRAALTNVEKQMNNVVRSIARLRIASGL